MPNLFYRDGDEVRRNVPGDPRAAKRQTYLDSIEELPYPFRDPEYRRYLDELSYRVTAQFETERGCPLQCAFCSWGTGMPIRRRRREDVEEGLTYLLNHPNVRAVYIVDANPFINNKKGLWLTDYLLHKNKTGKPVFFELNPEYVRDPRVIENLGQLAGDELAFGLQSTSDHTLQLIKRKFNRRNYERNVRRLRELNPDANIKVSLIVGLPGDNRDSFLQSLDFVISLAPTDIYVHDLLVLPGSEMYTHPERFGLTIDRRPPHRVLKNDTFPWDEYNEAKRIGYYAKLLHKLRWLRDEMLVFKRFTGRRYVDLYAALADRMEAAGLDGFAGDPVSEVSSEEFDYRTDVFVGDADHVARLRAVFAAFKRELTAARRLAEPPPAEELLLPRTGS